MGIDFSHCEARWAYSGFMRFRSRLAADLGYENPLLEMYNNGTYIKMDAEAIYPLIDHSDCEGFLEVDEMKQILPQLKSIIEGWDDSDPEKGRARSLVGGMEYAVECDERLEFM